MRRTRTPKVGDRVLLNIFIGGLREAIVEEVTPNGKRIRVSMCDSSGGRHLLTRGLFGGFGIVEVLS